VNVEKRKLDQNAIHSVQSKYYNSTWSLNIMFEVEITDILICARQSPIAKEVPIPVDPWYL
jgi:hypothetical protein